MELTSKGFLDKVTISAEEQTQTVLKTVAQIAFTLISGVPSTTTPTGAQRALRADADRVTEVPPKYIFDGFIDPTAIEEEIDPINQILPASYMLESVPVGGDPFSKIASRGTTTLVENAEGYTADHADPGETTLTITGSCVTGVCYRPARPYVLGLMWKDPDGGSIPPRPVAAYLLLVENSSPVFEVPVGRSAFIKRETTLDFDQGQLTSVEVKKPSELVQLVAWPLDILNAFFELPAKIFQFRFDNTKSQVALVQQQKALADAYADLIESRRALLALQSGDTPKESDETVGGGANPPRVGP